MNEKSNKKSYLVWKCRRGMLELDILLNRFLQNKFDQLSLDEQETFEKFLDEPDPELYAWLMGYDKPQSKKFLTLVKKIIS